LGCENKAIGHDCKAIALALKEDNTDSLKGYDLDLATEISKISYESRGSYVKAYAICRKIDEGNL